MFNQFFLFFIFFDKNWYVQLVVSYVWEISYQPWQQNLFVPPKWQLQKFILRKSIFPGRGWKAAVLACHCCQYPAISPQKVLDPSLYNYSSVISPQKVLDPRLYNYSSVKKKKKKKKGVHDQCKISPMPFLYFFFFLPSR